LSSLLFPEAPHHLLQPHNLRLLRAYGSKSPRGTWGRDHLSLISACVIVHMCACGACVCCDSMHVCSTAHIMGACMCSRGHVGATPLPIVPRPPVQQAHGLAKLASLELVHRSLHAWHIPYGTRDGLAEKAVGLLYHPCQIIDEDFGCLAPAPHQDFQADRIGSEVALIYDSMIDGSWMHGATNDNGCTVLRSRLRADARCYDHGCVHAFTSFAMHGATIKAAAHASRCTFRCYDHGMHIGRT